jgi:hypothetical protein
MALLEGLSERRLHHLTRDTTRSLSRQLAELQRDLNRIRSELAHRGGEFEDVAGDFAQHASSLAGDFGHELERRTRAQRAYLAHEARLQAERARDAIRSDPVPVVVAIAGVLLLGSLLMSRRRF